MYVCMYVSGLANFVLIFLFSGTRIPDRYGNRVPGSKNIRKRTGVARSHPVPGVVAGSGTMQILNIMDVISIFIHITHECMDSKKLIMWSHTESDV